MILHTNVHIRKKYMSLTLILDINLKDFMDSLDRLMMFGDFSREEIIQNMLSFRLLMLLFLLIKMATLAISEWDQLQHSMKIQETGVLLTK